jgi:hypothetical protein
MLTLACTGPPDAAIDNGTAVRGRDASRTALATCVKRPLIPDFRCHAATPDEMGQKATPRSRPFLK